jgi:hypothetical protein
MSALPHPFEATAATVEAATRPLELPRPAVGAARGRVARITALCCLVVLVPGEADRFGSGDFSRS